MTPLTSALHRAEEEQGQPCSSMICICFKCTTLVEAKWGRSVSAGGKVQMELLTGKAQNTRVHFYHEEQVCRVLVCGNAMGECYLRMCDKVD